MTDISTFSTDQIALLLIIAFLLTLLGFAVKSRL